MLDAYGTYDWDLKQRLILRSRLENSGIDFMRYFFKNREGYKFIRSRHHYLMQSALDEVLYGNISRLIINVPPGYTKTELAVLNFIAQGLAINHNAKFIHASYSSDLAHDNSSKIKEVVESDDYQQLWPMHLRLDKKGKKRWFTNYGGGMMAVSAGGQITGFRAGQMNGGYFDYLDALGEWQKGWFTGAFVIDDPIKPDDAFSPTKRNFINKRFNNTIRSRLAVENVPIIVIMQRLHEDDLSGYLLQGGSGDKWHHLVLPGNITEEWLNEPYPEEYTHGIPLKFNLPIGPLWEFKHNLAQLRVLEEGDIYTYNGQIQQRPSPMGGAIFKDHWWQHYDELPDDIDIIRIYSDTAQKTKEHNDYSVFQVWARSRSKGIFLIDQIRDKWEAPELESMCVEFWEKHKPNQFKPKGAQLLKVEDKSSGSSLIQSIQRNYNIPVEGIQRNVDKVVRAMGGAPQIYAGKVHLPKNVSWMHDYKDEFRKFTPLMTHKHDDQIDPTLDAIDDLLINTPTRYNESNIGTN